MALARLLLRWAVFLVSAIFTLPVSAGKKDFSTSAVIAWDGHRVGGALFDDNDISSHYQSEMRRLKFSAKYTFNSKLSSKVSTEADFDKKQFVIEDAYIDLDVGAKLEVTIGQFKEPFSMESLQGSTESYLMERSIATNALTFSRKPGVNLHSKGDYWNWDLAVMYIQSESPNYSDATAYTSRIAFAPIQKKSSFLHLGAGYTTRNGVGQKYDIDEPLIVHSAGNLIHSGNIKAKSLDTANLEFAGRYGPVIVQSEAFFQKILDREEVEHDFGGYYTTLLWTVQGRPRKYKNGLVDFVDSKKNTMELVLRYSMVDVEAYREGDIAEVVSMGINYYVRSSVRLSIQYEHANLKTFNANDWDTQNKGNAVSARFQLMM